MSVKRNQRVAHLLQEIIAETITFKLRDPAAKKATVSHVDVSENLRHVRIYVSVQGAAEERETTLGALHRATGFIKHEIGTQSDLKYVPQLEFLYDETLDRAETIEKLLRSLKSP